VKEHSLYFEFQSPHEVLDLLTKSSVRIAMVLELQTKEVLHCIHQAILEGTQKYKHADGFRIGWPALVASGKKPL